MTLHPSLEQPPTRQCSQAHVSDNQDEDRQKGKGGGEVHLSDEDRQKGKGGGQYTSVTIKTRTDKGQYTSVTISDEDRQKGKGGKYTSVTRTDRRGKEEGSTPQ